ncbi:LPS export ABC transporter periplasmic protein LptC [Massilia sp. B-10]|nr:LPS export ABC transporter periplasmic protein LptC [Massilia sp. B-10]UUZ57192.1 LPS export ABC transporter periplasmic protein LptC [Massilia sp. H-1]
MQRDDSELSVNPSRDEPDYIVEKFSFVRMDANGQPHYLFYGDKLTHLLRPTTRRTWKSRSSRPSCRDSRP